MAGTDRTACVKRLVEADPDVFRLVMAETLRIENTICLIAAENYPPPAIGEAQGSVFTIKAAEGYPGNRYHAGCEQADRLEALAVTRAKDLFGADHANVQPHSGTSANLAVYFSALEIGDRILAMKLSHGGHLSHGDASSVTSRCFDFRHYGLDPKTERIDYNRLLDQALSFRPRMIVAGASSYPRLIDYAILGEIARKVSAYLLVDMAHIAGLVAAKAIPSPVPHSDFVTFTTYKTLRGGRGGVILCKKAHAGKLEKAIFPGAQGTPSLNMITAKAVCFFNAMQPEFRIYQQRVLANASEFAASFERLGYRVVSGGTDTHLVLVDLRPKGVSGRKAEKLLASIGIVVNRNVLPNDPLPPGVTSGIRIGSPAMTTRGMGKKEVRSIVMMMDRTMVNTEAQKGLSRIARQVMELCRRFPVYSQPFDSQRINTMQCAKCQEEIVSGDEREHLGQLLCEDCYMDALSPAKACDPWAVHSAKSFEKEQGGVVKLSRRQKQILSILEETGGIEPAMLMERLNVGPADLEREIATLRHMEKLRAELRNGSKYIVLW